MDENQIIDILKINPNAYKYIDFSYKNQNFIIKILKKNIDITPYLEEFFLYDINIFRASFLLDSRNVLYFKLYLFEEKMIALREYPQIWSSLNLNEKDLDTAKMIFKEILMQHPIGYQFAPEDILADSKVALRCLEYYPASFEKLKFFNDNQEFALNAIKLDKRNYHYISESLKDRVEFIEKAIDKNGFVYEELENEYKFNKSIALRAIKKNTGVYYSFPLEFQNDLDFLDVLFSENIHSEIGGLNIDKNLENYFLEKYPKQIKENKNMQNNCINPCEWYHSLTFEEQCKKKNILKALSLNIPASDLNYWDIRDKKFFMEILEKDQTAISSLSFQSEISNLNDEKLIVTAIEKGVNPCLILNDLDYLSDKVFQSILDNDYVQFTYSYPYLFQDKESLILKALKKNPDLIKLNLVPLTPKFILEAVKVNPKILLESFYIQPSRKLLEVALFSQENSIFIEILRDSDYRVFLDEELLGQIFNFIGSLRRQGISLKDDVYDFLKNVPETMKRKQNLILLYIKSGGSDFTYFNQLITEIMLKLLSRQAFGKNNIRTKYLLSPLDVLPSEILFEELLEDIFTVSKLVNKDLFIREINKNLSKFKQLIFENSLTNEQRIFLMCFFLENTEFKEEISISKNSIETKFDLLFLLVEERLLGTSGIIDSYFLSYLRFFLLEINFDSDLFELINSRKEYNILRLKIKSDLFLIENLNNLFTRIFSISKISQDIEVKKDVLIIEGHNYKISKLIELENDKRFPKQTTLVLFTNILQEFFQRQKSSLTLKEIEVLYPEETKDFYNFFRNYPYKRLVILCKRFNEISKNYKLELLGSGCRKLKLKLEKR
ncbi:MAG: DUF4116 domain-containing protein [Fusobacteriaceae bacterium]